MAVPTAPTITTILTEAFRRCGIASPTAAQLLRAEDEWLSEAMDDITTGKRWHSLEETVVLIPQANVQAYPVPSPLFRVLRIRFYDGPDSAKGTAQSATSTTITLQAGQGVSTLAGRKIFLTGGLGAAQVNRVISLSGDVATVACPWSTIPDATTLYTVADWEGELSGPQLGVPRTGLGNTALRYWEEYDQTLRFYPAPDKSTYALELDGLLDIALLDETDARFVALLREWKRFLKYAVMACISQDNDDQQNADKYAAMADKIKFQLMVQDNRRTRTRVNSQHVPGGLPIRRYS